MPSQQSPQEQPSGRPGLLTLAIASASSVAAALLVSTVWGPGTLVGAAVTPVIVILLGELLRKPAEKISVIRVTASGTELHERTSPAAPPVAGELAPRSLHRSRRRPLAVALATGLLAFAIGAVVLTGSELVLGESSVGSSGERTTVFGGATSRGSSPQEEAPDTTDTAPPDATGTDAEPGATTPDEPAQTTPPSAPSPPAQTVPPAATTPAPPAPATGATGPR